MFVSYAQNFEDVLLWRALKDVVNGCYIDVGAQDPVADSVSKAFYDLGWRGVHVEPVPQYANLLRAQRPDEPIFQVALGATVGVERLYCIPDTGLSTVIEAVAKRHAAENAFAVKELSVPRMTLDQIFESLPNQSPVHWLKIDVEGAEKAVLSGWNKKRHRPWIVVIEATLPGSTVENFADWETQLTRHEYAHVYSDGLNRFYLADEHRGALGGKFAYPPNVFDDASLSGLAHSPWTYVVANRGAEVARELRSSLEHANLQRASELAALHSSLDALRQQRETEWHAAKENAANLVADRTRQELDLLRQLREAQRETAHWCQALAARESSFGEALSGHFREFQGTLQASMGRAEALAEQTVSAQREVIALTAQVTTLEVSCARDRDQFAQRERELVQGAERDLSDIAELFSQAKRLTDLNDAAQQRERELFNRVEQYETEIAALALRSTRLNELHDAAQTRGQELATALASAELDIARLIAEVASANHACQNSVVAAQTENTRLRDSISTLSFDHLREISAVRRVVEERDQRLQQLDQTIRALADELQQASRSITFWSNTAASYELHANAMNASWSWRITAPLRWSISQVLRVAAFIGGWVRAIMSLGLSIAKPLLVLGVRWIRRHPREQRWLLRWLTKMPSLRGQLLEFAAAIPLSAPGNQEFASVPKASGLLQSLYDKTAILDHDAVEANTAVATANIDVTPTTPGAGGSSSEFSPLLHVWQLGRRVNG